MELGDNMQDDSDEIEEIAFFIDMRLHEIKRLSRELSVSDALNVQASVDQLERLSDAVSSITAYVRYFKNNPLGMPILRKIASNWAYHDDYDPSWARP